MDSWKAPSHNVLFQIYNRLERNKPSPKKKTQTAYIVPPIKRGLNDPGPVNIREIITFLSEDRGSFKNATGGDTAAIKEVVGWPNVSHNRMDEIGSFGMFNLNCRLNIANTEKLRYILRFINESVYGKPTRKAVWLGSVKMRLGRAAEPYIVISRG